MVDDSDKTAIPRKMVRWGKIRKLESEKKKFPHYLKYRDGFSFSFNIVTYIFLYLFLVMKVFEAFFSYFDQWNTKIERKMENFLDTLNTS